MEGEAINLPGNTVLMFSGQGSNYYRMGATLFEREAVFRASMLELDAQVRELAGFSVLEEMYHPDRKKSDPFDRTLHSHPAIFMVEVSLAKLLRQRALRMDMVLGVSMGSFAAAVVGGYLAEPAALRAVLRQAEALEARCAPGGLLAVLGDQALTREEPLASLAEVATATFDGHFVLSAPLDRLSRAEDWLRSRGVACQRLPVSFAYHSQWIDPALVEFAIFERTLPRLAGALPLVCCATAAVVDALEDGFFARAARRPMRFREAIAMLETGGPHRYVDAGPSGTLATFLRYILPPQGGSSAHAILTPFGQDLANLEALVGSARA